MDLNQRPPDYEPDGLLDLSPCHQIGDRLVTRNAYICLLLLNGEKIQKVLSGTKIRGKRDLKTGRATGIRTPV